MNARRAHCGAAAIEFAFVLPIFILIFYGFATFGSAFYTQLAVSRAAEDAARSVGYITTARAVADIPNGAATVPGTRAYIENAVKDEVINSLTASSVAPSSVNGSSATRKAWLISNVKSQTTVTFAPSCGSVGLGKDAVSVKVSFPYEQTRILPAISIPGIGSSAVWMPKTLTGCAVVAL